MKKAYSTPKLSNYGNVETLTQAFGTSGQNDFIEYAGITFPGNGGSRDGVVVPK